MLSGISYERIWYPLYHSEIPKGYTTLSGETTPLALPQPILKMTEAISNQCVLIDVETVLTNLDPTKFNISNIEIAGNSYPIHSISSDASGITLLHLTNPVLNLNPIERYQQPLTNLEALRISGLEFSLRNFKDDTTAVTLKNAEGKTRYFVGFGITPLTEKQQQWINCMIIEKATTTG